MTRFASRLAEGRAFIPFFMLGDPDPPTSLRLLTAAVEAGADALELGIPFSDPIADGPTIQRAAQRALAAGVRPAGALEVASEVRRRFPQLPLGLLVYANLVAAAGRPRFYGRVADAGVDAVLVADVPVREGASYAAAAVEAGVDPVFIAAPNTPESALARLAELGRGFTYCVARPGVTGAGHELRLPPERVLADLARVSAPPAVIGFGISEPEHVQAAFAAGAAGAISGSAVVQRVEAHLDDPRAAERAVGDFVARMRR